MPAKLSEKIGYGFGDLSSSMFWKIFIYYLPIFYSNVFGLGLEHAAVLMLVTKLWDAVSDPMMGIIADRTETRWGKYRPYLLWMAAPFALIGVLLFTTPDMGYAGKHVWAYVTYILMMTVYTAINVPYGAMLGVVSANSKERTAFSSYRMFFAYGGSFVAIAIFEPLRDYIAGLMGVANPSTDPRSWQLAMLAVAVLCFIFFIACFKMTSERVKPVVQEQSTGTIVRDLKILVGNTPWWILLGVSITILLFNSIRGGVAAYYFADYLGSNNMLGMIFGSSIFLSLAIFLGVGEISNMIGVAIATSISNRLGKKGAYVLAVIVAGVFSLPFYFLSNSGDASQIWLMLVLQVIISIAAGVTLPLVWSMFADIADYSEEKTGVSSVGLIFSSSSMAQKFGGAFGTSLVLWLLASYEYQVPVNGVVVTQGAQAIYGLKALMSWIPALTAFLGAAIMMLYPLNETFMQGVRASLEQKRALKK